MATIKESVRTRFAPSPTGFLHIGGLRTALYSYAFAKSQAGKFILRIEDTDRRRFVAGSTEKIYQILKIFGLDWDEGPFIQSERVAAGLYRKYAESLLQAGHAYYCFHPSETKEEIESHHQQKQIVLRDTCRDLSAAAAAARIKAGEKPAVRLRLPDNQPVKYFDFVKNKEISWNSDYLDEVMLLKSDGFPTYHLAVVVDDHLMQVSHILRGHEWLSSTPIHLLLWQYLGFEPPKIGHLTAILDPEGGKLSKRKHNVSCEQFLAAGYLPEALLNFVMLLGWAPKDNRELFSLSEFVANFQKGSLQTANPVFDQKKLNWFNGQYIRQQTDDQLFKLLKPFAPEGLSEDLIRETLPLVKERLTKLSDYREMVEFLVNDFNLEAELLVQKSGGEKSLVKKQIEEAIEQLQQISDWNHENIEKVLRRLVEKNNWHLGKLFMGLRIALTGKTITPPLFESMVLLGKTKVIRRLKGADSAI